MHTYNNKYVFFITNLFSNKHCIITPTLNQRKILYLSGIGMVLRGIFMEIRTCKNNVVSVTRNNSSNPRPVNIHGYKEQRSKKVKSNLWDCTWSRYVAVEENTLPMIPLTKLLPLILFFTGFCRRTGGLGARR